MLRISVLVLVAGFSSPSFGWDRFDHYEEDRFEARFEIFDDVMLTLLCPDKQRQLPAAIEYWHWKDKTARAVEFIVDGKWIFNVDLSHKNQFDGNQFRADTSSNKIKFDAIVEALREGSELVVNSPEKAPVTISLKGSSAALKDCRA